MRQRSGLAPTLDRAVLGAALLVSCLGPVEATPPAKSNGPRPVALSLRASATAGCKKAVAAGDRLFTISVKGIQRSYLLSVPPTYRQATPLPLYFLFHGRGGDHGALVSLGLHEDAIGVFPDGLVQPGGGTGWDSSASGNDVALFDALLPLVEASVCIDTNKIYVAGFSWGGWMATRLACLRGNVVKGFASIEGGQENNASDCKGPVAGWVNHYKQDPAEPYSSGVNTVSFFAALDKAATPVPYDAPNPCARYSGSTPIVFCSPEGAIHAWPDFAKTSIKRFFASIPALPAPTAARGSWGLPAASLLVDGLRSRPSSTASRGRPAW